MTHPVPHGPGDRGAPGQAMYAFAQELYPLCRSITGEGTRETLRRIRRHIPIEINEVPSGTQVFDWQVPLEWNIRDAYIKDSAGNKIIDFQQCNLHVVGYSVPVHKKVSLAELKEHLFTLPAYPDWIPYRTSYYDDNWAFCMSHRQWATLKEGDYEVYIDSSLQEGSLSYGEYLLPGESAEEVLLSTHICHPSLANDNLSGIALLTFLAGHLRESQRRYSYRFLYIPGTIGSIAWLARNEGIVSRVRHGLVLSCLGDSGGPTYKKSRRGNAEIDRAVAQVFRHLNMSAAVIEEFSPYGYDERQFCSPGFDMPVGLLERSKYGTFPQYHTSADNLDFIRPEQLERSFYLVRDILKIIEGNLKFANLQPKCEPQLGRRGLYDAIGGDKDRAAKQMALLWVLNLSDGGHALLDIAERSGIAFPEILRAATLLTEKGLLGRCE